MAPRPVKSSNGYSGNSDPLSTRKLTDVMSVPAKIVVSRTELLAILNSSLAQMSECEDCQFDGPIWELQSPDASGSNWSDSLTLRCSGRAAGPCAPAAMRVAAAVQAKYNIAREADEPASHPSGSMPSHIVSRSVYLGFLIDANRINARQADAHMNRLEKWREDGVVEVLMSESSYDEARAGGDPRRAHKVAMQIFTMTMATTPGEEDELAAIERILFPSGALTQNERNDVDVVFNALKYRRILVTADGGSKRQPGGILGNRAALRELGVQIMTSEGAVALVEGKLRERDKIARLFAQRDRLPLPDWVGRD
jgi:hypothetical protein